MTRPASEGHAARTGFFASVLEVVPEMVMIHDEDTILYANAACRRALAANSPDELEGRSLDIIVHPDAADAGRERRRLLLEGGRSLTAIPLKLVTLSGQPLHLVADAHVLAVDSVRAALVVARP